MLDPFMVAEMEMVTVKEVLELMGFQVAPGVKRFTCTTNAMNVDQVMVNKEGLKIALRKNKKGKLELAVDEEELRKKEGIELKDFTKKVQRGYSYVTLKKQLTAEGYTVVEENRREDETIRLVVQRWR